MIKVQKLSLKNIILIAIAAAIIGVAFLVSDRENRTYVVQNANINSGSNSGLTIVMTSSTSSSTNALAYAGNWEKTLSTSVSGAWGTVASSSETASGTSLTPTDIFGEDILTRYMQAQNSGQDMTDPDVQQAVASQILADGTVLSSPKLYTDGNLNVSPDNSVAALTAYGNAAGLVYAENFIEHEGEIDIVQNSLDDNNPAELKQLDPIVAEYQGMLAGELGVKVPSSLANLHLDFVNALSELIFADQSFEKTYSDTLSSLNGLNSYQQGAADLNTALSGIETRLNVANISYTIDQPGIIFTYKQQ